MPRPTADPELVVILGRENAVRLYEAGVSDLAWLLRIARTPEGREQLCAHTGIPVGQLLQWAHMVDLCRIESLDPARASLLQKAGVRGLRDLVASDARELCLVLRRLDPASRFDRRTVEGWLRRARKMRPAVHDTAPPPGRAWDDEAPPADGLAASELHSSPGPLGKARASRPGRRKSAALRQKP